MVTLSGSETDGELYKLAAGGSREATVELVERYSTELIAYLRSKTDTHAAVEDASAEAWLKFFHHLRDAADDPNKMLRKPESVRFWLYRTALNCLRNEFRGHNRQRDLEVKATFEATALEMISVDTIDVFDAAADASERRLALRLAFGKLSEACRELLTLLTAEPPLGYQEVAEMIGRPVGSIGPTRKRCLNQLRYQLGLVS